MTQVDGLKFYFVLPNNGIEEAGCSEDMKTASKLVCKCGGTTQWIKPSDCIDILPQKKNVIVFDKFEGSVFDSMKQQSSKILGARCLITSLKNGKMIPPSVHPIFMEAMRNLFITSSGFDQATKKHIQEKIQFMGGHYDSSLRSIVTHLIAQNNITTKAIHAYKNKIKIMKLSWIEDVWQQNLISDIRADDSCFDTHISPLFHNLNITTSAISKREKDGLKGMIESHGGHFMGTLEANVTNILLVNRPEGEKYRVAQTWSILCLKPTWVQDCINAQMILPMQPYVVESNNPKASTPNKENSNVNFSANFTGNLSVIKNITMDGNKQLDETSGAATNGKSGLINSKTSNLTEPISFLKKNDKSMKSAHSAVINNILLKNIKEAGQFLDGINIYIYGFQSEDSEKLKKILNKGGAIRFNEMSESVTHVISGKSFDNNLAKYANLGAYILSVDWLVESIKLKSPANEAKFLIKSNNSNTSEPPSPMSKKGAQLLSQSEEKSIQKPTFGLEDVERLSQLDELLCRYHPSQRVEPAIERDATPPAKMETENEKVFREMERNGMAAHTSTSKTDMSSLRASELSSDEFFSGLTFFLANGLPEEEVKYLEDLIIERKGQIVKRRDFGVPDFAVVPVVGALLKGITAKEVVNVYFIKDCCAEGCLLTPRYYHQPVDCILNAKPLKNCVISVSNYVQGEREFMETMIEVVGGVAQSLLARKPKQGALKSTHLICAEPQGQKYEGAVRWGLPVVHHDWLLKCAQLGLRVSEKPYLVGASKMMSSEPEKSVTENTLQKPEMETKSRNAMASINIGLRKDTDSDDKMPPPPPLSQVHQREESTSPAASHQAVPIHSAIARVKATETPKSRDSPDPNRTITPTSPYGAFYGKGSPTPGTRKRIWKWMNQGADFPVDPPSKPVELEINTTPISELISRHLEMLKRKPEELPPDSPAHGPHKRLNLEDSDSMENASKVSVDSGLRIMKQIEEKYTRNGIKSPPSSSSTLKKSVESEGHQMIIVSESQAHTEVGWEDPVEKEIVLGSLEKAAKIEARPKIFMFSCITKDLEEIKALVEESGGIISSLPYFDKKATHLIAGNLTRAEKLMGSIAAGLWVLHPSYVDALRETKNVHEVLEEDHEWGSTKLRFLFNRLPSNAKDYAICSHEWRVAIKAGEAPAFKNVKILLHVSSSKNDSFRRLIEAGGGIVVKGRPPSYQNVEADLCVFEANNTEPINFASLAKRDIPCVALVYISDALLKIKDAIEKNLVPEFSQHWKK